jgi:hypothetical protein
VIHRSERDQLVREETSDNRNEGRKNRSKLTFLFLLLLVSVTEERLDPVHRHLALSPHSYGTQTER